MIITKDMLNKRVPVDEIPTRLDSALNLYSYVEGGLIVYNVNPATWNCLYPFYELNHKFTIDEYEFENKNLTYGDLIEEYQALYRKFYEDERGMTKDARKRILVDEYEKTFNLSGVSIFDELEPLYELKFSKSKNVWTLYYFENYCVGKIDTLDALVNQRVYDQKFMPLDKNIRQIDGVELVGNLPYVLANEDNIEKLEKNMLRKA